MDAEVVLQRFCNHTLEQDTSIEIGQHADGNSWYQLRKIFDAAVADKAKIEAKQLSAAVLSIQANNDILHTKIDGLRSARCPLKRSTIPGAILWTFIKTSRTLAALFSGVLRSSAMPAHAKPQNETKKNRKNSRKERQERQRQLRVSLRISRWRRQE
jgi:hypothetical protein